MNLLVLKGRLRRQQVSGFTLIELMIVLVVLGVMAGMAVVSFRNDPFTQLESEARRLQSILNFAADEAVLQGLLLGLSIEERRYQLVVFDSRKERWYNGEDSHYSPYELPEAISVDVELDGASLTQDEKRQIAFFADRSDDIIPPSLLLLSSGEITPFKLTLRHALADQPVVMATDGLSQVQIQDPVSGGRSL